MLFRSMLADSNTEYLRPALTEKGTLAEIEDLLTERRPHYKRASDFLIHTDGIAVAEIAHRILQKLNWADADKRFC